MTSDPKPSADAAALAAQRERRRQEKREQQLALRARRRSPEAQERMRLVREQQIRVWRSEGLLTEAEIQSRAAQLFGDRGRGLNLADLEHRRFAGPWRREMFSEVCAQRSPPKAEAPVEPYRERKDPR